MGSFAIAALYVIGVPESSCLSLLTGLVPFVPYDVPIVSVFPPALLAFAGDPIHAT